MIIKKSLNTINKKNRINLTIGTFDGFHHGHLKLLHSLTVSARAEKSKSCVITFRTRPKDIFNRKNKGNILSNPDRIQFFKKLGIDYLFYLRFDKKFSRMEAEDFLKKINTLFSINKIIVGNDFKFGYGNKGNVNVLKKFQKIYNFKLFIVKTCRYGNKKISSTLIKTFIENGDIRRANYLLGREYFLKGRVIKGRGAGIKIGFPTVNIRLEDKNAVIPGNGVYLSKIKYADDLFYGMTFIGMNHFTGKHVIETNIFNFSKKIYNKKIIIFLIKKLRKEIKFIKLEDLKEQLLLDRKRALQIIK